MCLVMNFALIRCSCDILYVDMVAVHRLRRRVITYALRRSYSGPGDRHSTIPSCSMHMTELQLLD